MKRSWCVNVTVGVLIGLAFSALAVAQGRGTPPQPQDFRFRFVGPAVGNRISAIAGIAGDPSIYYAGAAAGGVWKTTDGGNRFTPVFDNQTSAAIGALAVASSDPAVVWAGTGDPWAIRDIDVTGDGVYKSVDAGKTWKNMGLQESGRIGRILVHPANPDVVFVCALGRTTGPQQERGVYRTTDGGSHWDRVLFADENTGCSGLSMDAHNPRVLFAGMWQVEMHTYGMYSGGPGSGIYVSRDGGTTWTRLEGHGLPKPPVGKIDVAVAPTDSNRVYALIQTKDQGSVWRSDDGGENWRVINWARPLIGRAGFYIRIAVSTDNENEVMVANSSFYISTDGGETFRTLAMGGDTHDIWIDPRNPDRFVVTHDGGMTITTQHGRSMQRVTLPIGQMYHVAVDNRVPYYVYSNMQDDGTMRGVSTSPEGTGGRGGWEHGLGGCESGFTIPDPFDANIVWSTCYGNEITRYDARTKTARSVSPWIHTLDSPPNETKYRCHWTPPMAPDPFEPNTVYYGCQVIFKTANGGQSWNVISPDLSTNDPRYLVSSGGIVGDNLGQFYGEVVFAIAPSEIQKGLIWAGTNDGQLWYTRDGGGNWTNVSKNITGMPYMGTVTRIEPSHFEPGTAYVAIDAHLMDNRDPFIFKTADFGQTWKKISEGLPAKNPLDYVRAVAEDPNRKGILFAGTGHAFYYSLDDGAHWTQLQNGLPQSQVTWIVVQKQFRDVVVATFGRGIYILDDITPLEQMADAKPPDTSARLFATRPTYRFSRGGRALLSYTLKAAPKAPVKVEILDGGGKAIRELRNNPARTDIINRATWDLRYEPPHLVAQRTTPAENPHLWEEPRFRGAETRPVTHWGIAQAQVGPMVVPGKYSVRLTVDGQSFTQPLEILADPNFTATQADLEASLKLQLRIREDISATSDMVNQIEAMRKQLDDMQKGLRAQKKDDLVKVIAEMDKKMQDVEFKLIEKASSTSDDKYYVESYKVYLNLIWLNAEVGPGGGDVAGGADFRPTDASPAVLEAIEKDMTAAKAEFKNLMEKEVPAFNRAMGQHGLLSIIN